MSIVEKLTEGIVNRDMKQEGAALLNKWSQTGLLEGLDGQKAQNMAVLLENQAKQLLKESSSMGAGDVEGFAAVAFPIVRRVFAGLIANDLVSVQPMSLPSGLIFFLDFVYSPNLGASGTETSRFGNIQNASIYGTNKVGAGIIDGVDEGGGALDAYSMLLENNAEIPEIDIKVDSTAITAQTKKLKAKWTPELGQDLNAYHNLDAEVELTSILSEQIALEIDREILADLVNGATAATYYWSRSPGLFVNRTTGAEIGASSAAPDFTGTVSEWYETLIETINDVSAQIHRKTLRGGATHIVCSPEVANILEFTSGFRANVTADSDRGDIGAVKAGSLNRKFDVIVDPYFPRNVSWLVVSDLLSLKVDMCTHHMCHCKLLLPSLVWKTSFLVRES
jgi:hypothetical protein